MDSSTDEQPAYGRNLVEVFSVRAVGGAARPAPRGTVNVFDGRRWQILYSHGGEQPTPTQSSSHPHQDHGLLLTGPYRAISADGSVAINLDLHDPSSPELLAPSSSNKEAEVGFISWVVYDPSAEYDKTISRTVDTRYGPVEVTFAVLSNAVEATVEVTLVSQGEDDEACAFHGRIIARSQLFDIGIVLFDGEFGQQSSRTESLPGATAIPLARSILAVPLLWPLTVEVDLRARSGDEIVRGSLKFHPDVDDGQHVKRLVGKSGAIEVNITWSDCL